MLHATWYMLHKKSLGQHFLRNPRTLGKIVAAAAIAPIDVVLEVGPGEGTLTELLLQKARKVIAVEKDTRLIPRLQQRFAREIASGKLELVHADILDISVTCYMVHATWYKVVANLPYYITGQFLRKFLQIEHQPSSMTLLLQKEVAKRILAADGKESLLSISVKAYGTPRYIDTVKARAFLPPPKVDSAIIAIENISKEFFADPMVKPLDVTRPDLVKRRGENFFARLKKGFAHPRKLLSSNLDIAPERLAECGIDPKARAENVSLEQWKCLMSL